jgi:RHH-type rel operon transcriptional repressor/antitoxin RelB
MLTVRLSPKLEARLNRLAKRTGRTKTFYATRAIREFLDEQEDYLIAVPRLEGGQTPIPMDRVVRQLGLGRGHFRGGGAIRKHV